ncbi:MAG TPA: septum formation initiator family protein [Ignavibacteriales bacterium]|nr:septum formation initiator family protein [Ignavibacteriales bacterium]HOL81924.1 septum formation initiator family protein [Ignavibacteriales bacterium]HPD67484.1 septum formation initiator family protein [Ignavibacteriales bacterium]HPP34061.1 septum formation initiator family protein [Ignavibacteriales bacterium]HRR19050.1 septum formation initiator family protein [Ignavibacteriales bacterium]
MAKRQSFLTARVKIYIFILVFIICTSIILFNKSGLLAYYQAQQEKQQLIELKKQKEKELEELRYKEKVFQNLNSKEALKIIEKLAREKYEMSKPDEKVIKIKEK